MATVTEKLKQCIATLEEITESGYWPFASPAPCSTECKIKDGILGALADLEHALYWHQQMFDKVGRDPMKCVSMQVKEIKR